MTEIIGVRFKSGGKLYYFNPQGVQVEQGQYVIIETSKGIEFAECVQSNSMVDEMELVSTLRPMLRVATEADFHQVKRNQEREKLAYTVCQQKIVEHQLDMKLVEVKYSFDGSKVLFFFTADGRVDFRALVKDLAAIFHTRIELRQIGVRDEARMMGGLGICGRPFCCAQFLDDFQPVSIKMAKTQNISLNPTKISGSCGRLMCCLKYEQDAYEDLLKRTPKLDSLVKTPDGVGVINQINLLREQCRVTLDNDPDTVHIYRNSEIEIIRSGKGKRPTGYELPDTSALETPAPRPHKEKLEKESAPKVLDAPPPAEKPTKAERPVHTEQPEKPTRAERTTKADKPPRRQSQPEKADKPSAPKPQKKRPPQPRRQPQPNAERADSGTAPKPPRRRQRPAPDAKPAPAPHTGNDSAPKPPRRRHKPAPKPPQA